jgi:hypothetical protein
MVHLVDILRSAKVEYPPPVIVSKQLIYILEKVVKVYVFLVSSAYFYFKLYLFIFISLQVKVQRVLFINESSCKVKGESCTNFDLIAAR